MPKNQHEKNARLLVDGKEVKRFMFARLSRLAVSGCIPTDDGRRFIVNVQVEAFSKDHAINRLQNELYPMIPRADWDFICELDPEHDLGILGASHPFNPLVLPPARKIQ